MPKNNSEKLKNVDYFQVPEPLWKQIKRFFQERPKKAKKGRSPDGNRAILNGIWYILWTGCQWKTVHRIWFGVTSSMLRAFSTLAKQWLVSQDNAVDGQVL